MKRPIIKNWIKYFTGTLAVSGMLMVGGCDNNSSDRQETEVPENEVRQPTRENVSQEIEEEPVQTADNAQQNQQMSNRSSAQRAQQIRDIDSHIEEHKEANLEITKSLTGSENLEEGDAAGVLRGSTTTRGEVDSREQNTYDRESNTDLNDQESEMSQQNNTDQEGTATQQQNTYDQGTDINQDTDPTQEQNRLDQGEDADIDTTTTEELEDDLENDGMTGNTYDRQSNTDFEEDSDLDTQQGQDSQIEVDTDDQGTTEMNMDTREDMDNTNPQHNAAADEDDPRYENDGDDPTRTGINEQQSESDFSNQQQETTGTTQTDDNSMNQQGTTQTGTTAGEGDTNYENDGDDPTRTGINNQQGESEFDNQQQGTTSQQGTDTQQSTDQSATHHQQGNTEQMSQQEEGTDAIIYDRYSNTYPESYTDEDRKRTDDIMNEYEIRKESMRGQVNEETGAYLAPEVDAEPKEGYDQLMREISENITYPQNAAAAELEGTVFVNFIVDEEGNIDEVKAVEDVIVPASSLQSATNPLDPTKFHEEEIEEAKEEMKQEAIRAVEATSGKWNAGQQAGENVKSEVQIPVHFSIDNLQGTDNTIDNR